MKTSVTMTRRMGEFEIQQRTKDEMFNATNLLKQWNKSTGMKKQVEHFTSLKSTEEFLKTIQDRESKDRDYGIKIKRGKTGGTWMHPLLFIDFAMWINPSFKYDVLRFVHDQLLEFRNESGDLTKELNSSVQRFEGINYPQLAKALNHIIYDRHTKGIRDTGTEEQTKAIVELQKKLAWACDMGYIKSFNDLLEEMRRIWAIKSNS